MFCFVAVAVLLVAVDSAAVTCPKLPCPFTGFCKKTIPTYYDHDGVKCQGCDQCVFDAQDAPQLTTAVQLHMCPMVLCMNPGTCDVPYTYSHITFGGMNCTGCPSCPTGNHPDGSILLKKKALPQLIQLDMCPMVMCMAPGPCSVPLQVSTIHMGTKDCPGCAFCPTSVKITPVTE